MFVWWSKSSATPGGPTAKQGGLDVIISLEEKLFEYESNLPSFLNWTKPMTPTTMSAKQLILRRQRNVLHASNEKPLRVLLYNFDYFTTGIRRKIEFTLSGIPASSVSAKRLTADMATITIGKGNVSIAGQSCQETTCELPVEEARETVEVQDGVATFLLGPSEALVIDLQV
ncbi:hypothetical protein APSETT445_003856 [Aspergillus pseudonomiae]